MTDNAVFEKVREILCDQLDLENEEVTEESLIMDDLDADSLDFHDLRGSVEEEFDVTIRDEDAQDLLTVGDLVTYVEEHM